MTEFGAQPKRARSLDGAEKVHPWGHRSCMGSTRAQTDDHTQLLLMESSTLQQLANITITGIQTVVNWLEGLPACYGTRRQALESAVCSVLTDAPLLPQCMCTQRALCVCLCPPPVLCGVLFDVQPCAVNAHHVCPPLKAPHGLCHVAGI